MSIGGRFEELLTDALKCFLLTTLPPPHLQVLAKVRDLVDSLPESENDADDADALAFVLNTGALFVEG